MGLLDDAIREHLELKRRRGADATEISRQESDALGPVRRSPEGVPDLSDLPPLEGQQPAEAAGAAPEAPAPWAEETTVHTPPQAELAGPPLPPAATAPPTEPPVYEPPPVPAAPEPVSPPPAAEQAPAEADEPPAGETGHHSLLSRLNPAGRIRHARHEPDSEPPEAPPAAHEPPADDPDIVPADDEPEGEELLEETPDFLEETPEHDRLWFEQRPPRDFNFDE